MPSVVINMNCCFSCVCIWISIHSTEHLLSCWGNNCMVEACLQWSQQEICCILVVMLIGSWRAKWSCKATCGCVSVMLGKVETGGHAVCVVTRGQFCSWYPLMWHQVPSEGLFISPKDLAKKWFAASVFISATVFAIFLCLNSLITHMASPAHLSSVW